MNQAIREPIEHTTGETMPAATRRRRTWLLAWFRQWGVRWVPGFPGSLSGFLVGGAGSGLPPAAESREQFDRALGDAHLGVDEARPVGD
ncbi:hypothetical protein, partial [Pseudomonas aeruginosa]